MPTAERPVSRGGRERWRCDKPDAATRVVAHALASTTSGAMAALSNAFASAGRACRAASVRLRRADWTDGRGSRPRGVVTVGQPGRFAAAKA